MKNDANERIRVFEIHSIAFGDNITNRCHNELAS